MTVLSYQEIKEDEMLQFGEEKTEGEWDGGLERSQGNAELLFTMFHRARTNRAIGEPSGRSI